MTISSEFIVNAFIKRASSNMFDAFLIKRGDSKSGEIFLRLNNLAGCSKIYSYRKTNIKNVWEIYGSDLWREDKIIKEKLEKIINIDPDIWIIELEDKTGKYIEEH